MCQPLERTLFRIGNRWLCNLRSISFVDDPALDKTLISGIVEPGSGSGFFGHFPTARQASEPYFYYLDGELFKPGCYAIAKVTLGAGSLGGVRATRLSCPMLPKPSSQEVTLFGEQDISPIPLSCLPYRISTICRKLPMHSVIKTYC